MTPISAPGGNDRHPRFIGFERELGAYEEWAAGRVAGMRLFSVSGIGGIGKTTLLVEIARRSRESSITTLWLDGHGELSTSSAFLASLEASLESEHGRTRPPDVALLPYILQELVRRRAVLLLDNGESIERLEGWLLSSFLPSLQDADVLVVIASRHELSVKWRTNPHWGSRFHPMPLRLFAREEVLGYLRESGLSPELRLEVAQRTDGHPLLLALTVEWLRSRRGEERQSMDEIPSILSAELLREVASPALYPALTVLSSLPEADMAMLNRLLDAPLGLDDYRALGRLSFVRMTPHGLTLHHAAAGLLREQFAGSDPARFQAVRQRAIRLLSERFHSVDKRRQMRYSAHILELYREFLPSVHAYASFSSRLRPGEYRSYQPEDLPILQRFLAASASDWQSELARPEEYAALLADIADRCPEGICIVRDDRGAPLAFCAGVWLHRMTLPLLERYAPGFLPILAAESERLQRLDPEAADSLCILLAAVDVRQTLYRPEELGALLMRQWLVLMTTGLRGLMVTGDTNLNSLLPIFGFKARGQVALPSDKLTIWELDFRQASFDEWVQAIIRQTGEPTASPSPGPANEAESGFDYDAAKRLLEKLFEADPSEREAVLELLASAPPAPPLTAKDQFLLRELYVQKSRNREQLADALYMSRTTFYRHSRAAIRRLADALRRSARERFD